jgi:hypothetical protein
LLPHGHEAGAALRVRALVKAFSIVPANHQHPLN